MTEFVKFKKYNHGDVFDNGRIVHINPNMVRDIYEYDGYTKIDMMYSCIFVKESLEEVIKKLSNKSNVSSYPNQQDFIKLEKYVMDVEENLSETIESYFDGVNENISCVDSELRDRIEKLETIMEKLKNES